VHCDLNSLYGWPLVVLCLSSNKCLMCLLLLQLFEWQESHHPACINLLCQSQDVISWGPDVTMRFFVAKLLSILGSQCHILRTWGYLLGTWRHLLVPGLTWSNSISSSSFIDTKSERHKGWIRTLTRAIKTQRQYIAAATSRLQRQINK